MSLHSDGGMNRMVAKGTIVEIDGDEMTRVIWNLVKAHLIDPFVELKLEYYDWHVSERDRTDDAVTVQASEAIKRHHVGVKCATITPDAARVTEYKLKKAWPSPNGTLRAILDGTVFRKPIIVKNIPPMVRAWKRPIVIGRHAYGDVYRDVELKIPGPGKVELIYTPAEGGAKQTVVVHDFQGAGVVKGEHNTEKSIRSFARACIHYALSEKIDLWFAAKDTISKIYHASFKNIFREEVEARKADFERAGITYSYMLIDDAVARVMRHEGGFLWALRNYDGDVMSDMLASGYGSLGLMTSVLVSPDGHFEFEAAHGTVTRHYRLHQQGQPTSTNSTATIFAWTGAIAKRGELDGTPELVLFAHRLEDAVLETIQSGIMTKDLAAISEPRPSGHATTEGFITAVAERLRMKIEAGAGAR